MCRTIPDAALAEWLAGREARRDGLLQLPADGMPVSIDILDTAHSSAFRDQFRFDIEHRKIDGILTRMSLEPMLALAAHYGGADGMT